MIIYTYQPQELIDKVNKRGFIYVDFAKTNLYRQSQLPGRNMEAYHEAYMWMARKLAEKTGIWMKTVYGSDLDIQKDADGDYIDEEGQKLPIFPFWGWYITDGKKENPDESYCFDRGADDSDEMDWNLNWGQTRLVTLEIPDRLVLLSDANAWYCALEGRPCYEFETEEDEQLKTEAYQARFQDLLMGENDTNKKEIAQELWVELTTSWENILRTEGRRLRCFEGPYGKTIMEKYDIQAAFPVIFKEWIVSVEEVWQ